MTFEKFRAFRETPADQSIWEDGAIEPMSDHADSWKTPAKNYVPHPNVVEAVNVAIALGKPLLVTGEPGVGKSLLAYAVAWQLNLVEPFKFVAKSTSEARDLFYRYDALGRYYAIEAARHITAKMSAGTAMGEEEEQLLKRPDDARNFIEYSALGRAILSANEKSDVENLLAARPDGFDESSAGTHRRIFEHPGERSRSVVLIDEIDKASADFCNDLLDEIDNFRFTVPEVQDRPTPEIPIELRPFVLITSNRERELPNAFLRRCVFVDIPFPQSAVADEKVRKDVGEHDYYIETILAKQVREAAWTPLATSAVLLVTALREKVRLSKKPGTAELIDMLRALKRADADMEKFLGDQPQFVAPALRALVKTREDQQAAERFGLPDPPRAAEDVG